MSSPPEDRFDGMFLAIAQQAQGIEPLLDNLFSFLRRKTDFYSGASNEQIESLVLKVVRKHTTLAEQTEREKRKEKEREEKKRKERIAKQKQVPVVLFFHSTPLTSPDLASLVMIARGRRNS